MKITEEKLEELMAKLDKSYKSKIPLKKWLNSYRECLEPVIIPPIWYTSDIYKRMNKQEDENN